MTFQAPRGSPNTGALAHASTGAQVFGVPLGAEERRTGLVRMKNLENGDQHDVAASEATAWLMERLAER